MTEPIRVGLFVTCLVDLLRPSIGFATVKLLQQAGCEVIVPEAQTCCGQPAFNNGDLSNARAIACQVIDAFESFDYVVGPSGSCIGMIKSHYPELFADDPDMLQGLKKFANKTYEILEFLNDILKININVNYQTTVTYHDSCSGLRELGVKAQPRALLKQVSGLELNEMEDTDICCGFGGTFCVKYPDISTSLVTDKVSSINRTNATVLLGGDLGCLLNIAGRCQRLQVPVRCFHTVEVLAGMADGPAIGEPET